MIDDETEFRQTLVAAFVSAAQSMADEMPPSATLDFQSTIEFLIIIGLVERLPSGSVQPAAGLVELLRADLEQEGFPTKPSKRAVCLSYTVVLQARIAWDNAGACMDGGRLPASGSSDWFAFIARSASRMRMLPFLSSSRARTADGPWCVASRESPTGSLGCPCLAPAES